MKKVLALTRGLCDLLLHNDVHRFVYEEKLFLVISLNRKSPTKHIFNQNKDKLHRYNFVVTSEILQYSINAAAIGNNCWKEVKKKQIDERFLTIWNIFLAEAMFCLV